MHLSQLRGPGGVWTAFASTCHKEGSVFWTLKTRKTRDVNTGLPSMSRIVVQIEKHVASAEKLSPYFFLWLGVPAKVQAHKLGVLKTQKIVPATNSATQGQRIPENAPIHRPATLQWTCVKTRERRGSSFSQLGLEPNHTGLTAQSLFFLEESCRVKRSDTQTFSNFSNYFKRVLKLQKRSSSFSK